MTHYPDTTAVKSQIYALCFQPFGSQMQFPHICRLAALRATSAFLSDIHHYEFLFVNAWLNTLIQ